MLESTSMSLPSVELATPSATPEAVEATVATASGLLWLAALELLPFSFVGVGVALPCSDADCCVMESCDNNPVCSEFLS